MVDSNIKFTKEQYNYGVEEIRKYFQAERDESIGVLQGELFMDFIIEKIGPFIYNQAIDDMHRYMSEKVEDMYGYLKG